MDFFKSQDDARRNTRVLLVLFSVAVLSLVGLTNLLVYWAMGFRQASGLYQYDQYPTYNWITFLLVSAGVLIFIFLGSTYRVMSLAGGGEAVAAMVDGQLIADAGDSLEKRRLLNVVEEMAIASGVPVPPVYVIDDQSINAFAAGHSPGDAVIGITEGAIQNLNRDQLQGVIAHEFSHILNGDMKLNIRLIGVLYGILMIAIIGRILVQGNRYSVGYNYRTGRDNRGNMVMLGLGLMFVGYLGKFFGSLIKAAVSRQREFLADASAVQFTRNPDGIGGALKRIGGYSGGTVLLNPKSEEISHAFFAQGIKISFMSMLATHPPLDERIRRIDPRWDGTYIERTIVDAEPERARPSPADSSAKTKVAMAAMAAGTVGMAPAGVAAATGHIDADKVMGDIGNPGDAHIAHARKVIDSMPDELEKAAHETYSARAIVYLVLLDSDELVRSRQIDYLSNSADMFVLSRFKELMQYANEVTPHMRLPLVELALPALRQLSESQYGKFKDNVEALIHEDHKVGLSEWALQRVVNKHLGEALEGKRSKHTNVTLKELQDHIARLMSMLAYADRSSGIAPAQAFEKGKAVLDLDISLLPKQELSLSSLNAALDALADLRPLRKPKLLKACIATITADNVVSPVEQELVRAIADTLDCPMPPIAVQGAETT